MKGTIIQELIDHSYFDEEVSLCFKGNDFYSKINGVVIVKTDNMEKLIDHTLYKFQERIGKSKGAIMKSKE